VRAVRDEELKVEIARVHKENYGVYGIRKIHAQLGREGVTGCADRPVARCTTQRLMKDLGLRGISRAKGPRTTVPGSGPDTRPDLVEREFVADAPDRLWVADITYCRTYAGWVYAAFVLDVFSRRVVGWQLSTSLRTDLALDALNMGLWTRQHDGHDTSALVHHSDRGVQGGLNRSSQHPEISEVRDGKTATAIRSSSAESDEISRPARPAKTLRARVLASHRRGHDQRGCRFRGRRVGAGGHAMVSTRWRHAAHVSRRAHRPLPVC
jgi:putative transposase